MVTGELISQVLQARKTALACLQDGDVKNAVKMMHTHLNLKAELAMARVNQFEATTKFLPEGTQKETYISLAHAIFRIDAKVGALAQAWSEDAGATWKPVDQPVEILAAGQKIGEVPPSTNEPIVPPLTPEPPETQDDGEAQRLEAELAA